MPSRYFYEINRIMHITKNSLQNYEKIFYFITFTYNIINICMRNGMKMWHSARADVIAHTAKHIIIWWFLRYLGK